MENIMCDIDGKFLKSTFSIVLPKFILRGTCYKFMKIEQMSEYLHCIYNGFESTRKSEKIEGKGFFPWSKHMRINLKHQEKILKTNWRNILMGRKKINVIISSYKCDKTLHTKLHVVNVIRKIVIYIFFLHSSKVSFDSTTKLKT